MINRGNIEFGIVRAGNVHTRGVQSASILLFVVTSILPLTESARACTLNTKNLRGEPNTPNDFIAGSGCHWVSKLGQSGYPTKRMICLESHVRQRA